MRYESQSNKNDIPTRYEYSGRPAIEYSAVAPTLDADELMSLLITRSSERESIVMRRFSQTPLSPELIYDLSLPYRDAARMVLTGRVEKAADEINLRSPYLDAVQLEVDQEFERRLRGNSDAAKRLYNVIYGTMLSDNEAELIWQARTGDATLSDTAELLLRYPVMSSIEGAKYTQPFDPNINTNMIMHIWQGLSGLADQLCDPGKLKLEAYSPDNKKRNPRYIEVIKDEYNDSAKTLLSCIMATKDNIAELTDGKTVIQLVRKQTMVMLPPDLEVSVHQRNKSLVKGRYVNLQPISISYYWRTILSNEENLSAESTLPI